MQQLTSSWNALDLRRKAVLAVASATVIGMIVILARMASDPSLSLLYSGLESSAAGEVVRSLEQRGVTYEVRGGSIFVDASVRDELRMTLASEGLPTNSSRGYELLDNLTGFGTTSQMFDAAYWRAKEGELARTIVASPTVAAARVHIANGGSSPFQRGIRPSASVTLTPNSGAIAPKQAKAIRFLVASGVPGLQPDDVSVIDSNNGLIGNVDEAKGAAPDSRSDVLRERVMRLLEARVGFGNAVVEVSVDTETQAESIRERRFDPENRVAISTDTEERSNSSQDAAGDSVTVASNLPDGDAATGQNSSAQTSETRERVNYEVSETEREIIREPGAVRRITVAVMVNGTPTTNEAGESSFVPRSDAELADIRELVASAVGLDEERGDVVTVKSMEFIPIDEVGSAPPASFWSTTGLDLMSIIQTAVLALVALVLGLFVVRPLLASGPQTSAGQLPAPEATATAAAPPPPPGDLGALPALSGVIEDGPDPLPGDLPSLGDLPTADFLPMAGGGSGETEKPVDRLRQLIADRKEDTAEVLQSWLEEREERA